MTHDDFRYAVVSRNGNRRPRVLPLDTALAEFRRPKQRYDAHLSVSRYGKDLLEYRRRNGRVAGYDGPCYADCLPFDIDRGQNGIRVALGAARELALTLHERFGLREDQVRYFFSGSKGFHLLVPMILAGDVAPSRLTPQVLRRMAQAVADTSQVELDYAIYRRLGMLRMPGTQHPKTQRWKTELSWDEFSGWAPDRLLAAASGHKPRAYQWTPHDLEPSDPLAELYSHCVSAAKEDAERPRPEPRRHRSEPLDVDAVVEVLRPFYVDGHRDRLAFTLGGYLAKQGVSQEDAQAVTRRLAAGDDDGGEKSVGRVNTTYDTYQAGGSVRGWKGLEEDMSDEALRELARLVEPVSDGTEKNPAGLPRQTILLRQELNAVSGEAVQALLVRPDLNIFVRGGRLVTIGRDGAELRTLSKKPPGSLAIRRIEAALLMSHLDSAAEWKKFEVRTEELVAARPQRWVADQILSRIDWPFRYLEAVVETPTIRPDGTILDTPGWDEQTCILYEPMHGQKWPGVPERPSQGDVDAAVAALLEPVTDFPFVANTDRAAYVAAALSLLGRQRIDGPVPLFAVRAPTPGTGKGLLAQVIGTIGTGRMPPAMTMSSDGEELRKRITALALAGSPAVLLDNLSGSVGCDSLAVALTTTEWEDRLLGSNEMVRLPLRLVWMATGNNITFKRTLGRRVVPLDLDARVQSPEDRRGFQHTNLLTHVKAERLNLVAAGLTILRAHHLAGRPAHGEPRMGSFEAWDDAIRSAVVWARLGDPAGTGENGGRGRIRCQADDDLEHLSALLEILQAIYPNYGRFSSADVVAKAKEHRELQAALNAAAPPRKGEHADTRSIGSCFRDHQDRPIGGLVLRRVKRDWKVEAA